MKLISFRYADEERVGVLSEDQSMVRPCAGVATMLELIAGWGKELNLETPIPLHEVEMLAPIPHPARDIICIGLNYPKHVEEVERKNLASAARKKGKAVYFCKGVHTCTPNGGTIESHGDLTQELDYEAELAVILGRDVRNLTPEQVSGAIFGYTVINDVSARDLQEHHKQFYFGKSLDSFAPMGPWVVTADEVEFPPCRQVWSRVNGELRQYGNTEQMTFSISDILCELTKGMTLPVGTIIATGTPDGVGIGFDPPRFLKSGDVVKCGVEGIGSISNPVV